LARTHARLLHSWEEAFFVSATRYLGPDEIARTIRRLGHEIVESNHGTDNLVLVGLLSRGYPLAKRLAAAIREFEGVEVPVGSLDIGLYRDDVVRRSAPPPVRPSDIPVPIDGKTVVLVDDVLFTGRSVRAALDALLDFGRPARVRLCVLVDRGHRELPIRPDFVGKNIPTALVQRVRVRLSETDGEDAVYVYGEEAASV
jgi:pyrimidine operon attenuation protein/uracil phosphoribosyltransferase